jgi:hypothetical protein
MTSTATFPHTHKTQLPAGNGKFSVLKNGALIIYPESSAIEMAQYQDETLSVTYTGGKTYYYREVPTTVVFHLLVTESFGKFINTHIKPNYEFWQGS